MTRFARLPLFPQIPLLILGVLAAIIVPRCVKRDAPPPPPGQPGQVPAPSPAPRPRPPESLHSPARPAFAPVAPSDTYPRSPLADSLNSPTTTAHDDLAALDRILALYRERFGAFPAFEINAQLVNALAGANPHRIALLPRDASAISPDTGQLLDRWGSPYHFHAISRDTLEVRGAGPDRILHTADDLVRTLGAPPPPPAP